MFLKLTTLRIETLALGLRLSREQRVQRNAYSSSLVSLCHNQRISKRLETIGFARFIWWHESTYAAHNGIRHCFTLAQIILTTLNRMNRIKMNTHSIWMWTTTKLPYMVINVPKFGFIKFSMMPRCTKPCTDNTDQQSSSTDQLEGMFSVFLKYI